MAVAEGMEVKKSNNVFTKTEVRIVKLYCYRVSHTQYLVLNLNIEHILFCSEAVARRGGGNIPRFPTGLSPSREITSVN